MTLKEAKEAGYKCVGTAWTQGYVTRKSRKPEDVPMYVAGGSRKGSLYHLSPSFTSTQYCFRVYYKKEGR